MILEANAIIFYIFSLHENLNILINEIFPQNYKDNFIDNLNTARLG